MNAGHLSALVCDAHGCVRCIHLVCMSRMSIDCVGALCSDWGRTRNFEKLLGASTNQPKLHAMTKNGGFGV